MTHTRQRLGWHGERLAERYLTGRGLTILERNYRCPAGEADLIARDGETLVFVEVRTRRGQDYGTPEESITARKQAHLLAVAQTYLAEHSLNDIAWRIDVVAVALSTWGELLRIAHFENAIEG